MGEGIRLITQTAPYPDELEELVDGIRYRPGWSFQLVEGQRNDEVYGLALLIVVDTVDAYDGETHRPAQIAFPFMVPPELRSRDGWQRWLYDRIADAERHERGEFFEVDGEKPFAPRHYPEPDGYLRLPPT
ncbi:hypothetical protein KIY77_gp06 [Mycobacterium phage Mundrea]|uniref:Uncharacterized protein n=1 Tax=Mycobacterium phage Mundrea TaxID=1897540 RepID=A0A1C9LYG1_9CAUD|nr:hypothetical protein KIY77_gp06 [Mycobacterium phage Mundrea]AOQ27935.1 hypothetical protein SEA_MUNDREA_6 [Mycobacterium phage Mundrea]